MANHVGYQNLPIGILPENWGQYRDQLKINLTDKSYGNRLRSSVESKLGQASILQIQDLIGQISMDSTALKRLYNSIPRQFTNLNESNWGQEDFDNFIKMLAECSKSLQESNHAKNSPSKPNQPNLIDVLIIAFSYFAADHEPPGPYDAISMLQIYAIIIALPFVFAYTGESLFARYKPEYIDSLVLVGMSVVLMLCGYGSIKLYKKFRPIPSVIKPMRNYTSEAKLGNLEPLLCRDDVIEKIFLCWQSSNNTLRQHPLLVGPPGAGKTVILKEVARRIVFNEIPKSMQKLLKGKQMFGGSASSFLPGHEMFATENKLERFLRLAEPYRNDIILALDELRVLMTNESTSELLKSILDTSFLGLPFVIATVTDKEYQQYFAGDVAISRRFKVIHVDPLNEIQVKLILREMVRKQFPNVSVNEDLLSHIYQSTSKEAQTHSQMTQPEVSKQILTTAISLISLKQLQPSSGTTLFQQRVNLANAQSNYLGSFNNIETLKKSYQQIEKEKEEINKTLTTVKTETRSVNDYQKISSIITQLEEKLASLARKIIYKKTASKIAKWKRKMIFIHNEILPVLKVKLNDLKIQLKIPDLAKPLIDQLIKEYVESIQAVSTTSMNWNTGGFGGGPMGESKKEK